MSGPTRGSSSRRPAAIPRTTPYCRPIHRNPPVHRIATTRQASSCARMYAARVRFTSSKKTSPRQRSWRPGKSPSAARRNRSASLRRKNAKIGTRMSHGRFISQPPTRGRNSSCTYCDNARRRLADDPLDARPHVPRQHPRLALQPALPARLEPEDVPRQLRAEVGELGIEDRQDEGHGPRQRAEDREVGRHDRERRAASPGVRRRGRPAG